MYLAYDPGKTTGWVRFNDDGSLHSSGQYSLDELMDHVNAMEAEHVYEPVVAIIYESFRLFKKKAVQQAGSEMEASQAIGIIKVLHNRTGCDLVKQDPTIKSIAQKWTGVSPHGSHKDMHWVDAFNHGAFYLIQKGVRKTALEQENSEK